MTAIDKLAAVVRRAEANRGHGRNAAATLATAKLQYRRRGRRGDPRRGRVRRQRRRGRALRPSAANVARARDRGRVALAERVHRARGRSDRRFRRAGGRPRRTCAGTASGSTTAAASPRAGATAASATAARADRLGPTLNDRSSVHPAPSHLQDMSTAELKRYVASRTGRRVGRHALRRPARARANGVASTRRAARLLHRRRQMGRQARRRHPGLALDGVLGAAAPGRGMDCVREGVSAWLRLNLPGVVRAAALRTGGGST
jgi:hypothetical protein